MGQDSSTPDNRPPAVVAASDLPALRDHYRGRGLRIVSTCGCFDLIHAAHVRTLAAARLLGDVLVVGLNDDDSVRLLKGPARPLVPQRDRAEMLASLKCVDHVVIFSGLLPNDWLELLRPDVHCKSADYSADSLPEAPVVLRHGGRVEILPLEKGYSTSDILARLAAPQGPGSTETQRGGAPVPPRAPPVSAVGQSPTAINSSSSQSSIVNRQSAIGNVPGPSASVPGPEDPTADLIRAMLSSANEHRQLAYRLAPAIIAAAKLIASALREGRRVFISADQSRPWLPHAVHAILAPVLRDRVSIIPASIARPGSQMNDVVIAATSSADDERQAAIIARAAGAALIAIAPPGNDPAQDSACNKFHALHPVPTAAPAHTAARRAGARPVTLIPVESETPAALAMLQLSVVHALAAVLPRFIGAKP